MSMLPLLADAVTTTVPNSGGTEALLIGAVVALGQGLVKLVESLVMVIAKKKNGGTNEPRGCIACQGNVERVVQVVSQVDSDGAPLIYGGHQVAKKMDRVADELASVSRKLSEKTKE